MATPKQRARGHDDTDGVVAVADVPAPDAVAVVELFELTSRGNWLYKLQEKPEYAGAGVDPLAEPFIVRLSGQVYAKHLRLMGQHEGASQMFYLIAAMCNLPADLLDRFHSRDYGELAAKVAEIAKTGND